ncbi:hypothetical protein ACFFTN_01215 [Aminobacter aganoensis]|uniref:Uncharacterized protein n=1 Tax=Aminobacter aganoensis TaxID=83264 RepID=A0A7X0F5K7_9HYPH|nr:hypothetical protein [Aminobacter aganoensis]MBB6353522.1 hypothetical protein [Aminobacter aganoensis]
MSLYNFCTHLRNGNDLIIVPDFECQIEVSVGIEGSIPEYTVGAIIKDGVDLTRGPDAFSLLIASQVEKHAMQDCRFLDLVNEREGIVYRGMSYNDPAGYWRAA